MVQYKYLLDTNILSNLIKQPDGKAARKIATLESENLCCTSVIVACELRYGAQKKASSILTAKVNQLLEAIAVLPLKHDVESQYAMMRVALERVGTPIGGNDLLIASHAAALGLTLVTGNVKEFSRLPDLVIENWLD
jgi:tRNA(fMet)-specific endonuclease VapC